MLIRVGNNIPVEPVDEIESTGHTYVVTEDGQPTGEVLSTSDSKLSKVVASALSDSKTGKPTRTRPNLRETQDVLRLAILSKTGGIVGIVETLEDARTRAYLPNSMEPDHRVRLKAAEVELRLMGLMGTEAAAAVEEAKGDTSLYTESDDGSSAADRKADFLRRVRAKQMQCEPEEVKFELNEKELEALSPVSVGKEYVPPPLPKRYVEAAPIVAKKEEEQI